jgi:hypothetical protein
MIPINQSTRRRGGAWRRMLSGRLVAYIILLTLGLTLLSAAPFAAAGMTGNALWIAAPVAATLLYVLIRETPRCLAYYRSLAPLAWLPALAAALVALAVTLGIGAVLNLAASSSVLDWSLGSLFHVGADAGINGFAVPLSIPWMAAIYAPPALLALPLLAWWEEDIFRRGTRGWRSALARSTVFGLLHLTAGVTLGACVALGAAGLVFTWVYRRALRDPDAAARRAVLPAWARERVLPHAPTGPRPIEDYAVYRATQAHLLYNVIGVCVILLVTLI